MVCRGHRHKIERMIAELPGLYDDLGTALTWSEKRDAEQGKAKNGAKNAGLNLNHLVVDARDEIHAELVRMVRHIAEERSFTPPADTVGALATWLTVQIDWLCAQPDADETHDNLDRLTRDCWSLAYPAGRRRFVIPGVVCEAPLFCDAVTREVIRCPGRLVALLMPDDDRENLSEITCEDCGLEVPLKAAALPGRWATEEMRAS
jgi:hypothetical protein